MRSLKLGKFYRVQTTGRDKKAGVFVTRISADGSEVITLKRDTYMAAKKAAAKALRLTSTAPAKPCWPYAR